MWIRAPRLRSRQGSNISTENNRVQSRTGGRSATAAPHGIYRCQGNDRWCAIAVSTDAEWNALRGPTYYMGPAFNLSATPAAMRPAPCLGQHNAYVYGELLGMTEVTIDRYTQDHVFY